MDDDLQLLCEIGFASVRRGVKRDATDIFDALSLLRPENACGHIGHALTQARRGDFHGAIEILQDAEQRCTQAVQEATDIKVMITEFAEARAA